MGWEMEHSAESNASPEAVWRRYVDVENWSQWSQKGVERSSIDGDFEVGTMGKSKPPGVLPAGRFKLIAVEPERKFVSEVRFPGASLIFEHVIEPRNGSVLITHRCIIDGPLTFLLTAILRRKVEGSLPDGVDRLAAMAAEDEERAASGAGL